MQLRTLKKTPGPYQPNTPMKEIHGICIYCGDPRKATANLWKYIKAELIPEAERYTPIGQLGGAIPLARPADFPIKFAAIMEDIKFALEEFAESKFILVGHDCGIYKRLAPKNFTLEEKKRDIALAAAFLREYYPNVPVSAWFKNVGVAEFEKIS